MNYEEAMEYVANTTKFGMNLGLQRINKLLEYMGNPEKNLKCIHVAGTNGKGSITSMIASILIESGFRVGVYTSPHLQRFSERIKINSDEISHEDIAALITYIRTVVDRVVSEGYEHPTEFEIITAIMFKYFDDKNVDIAVVEVGLGGRMDSTNVINPLLSVITSISFDHMGILGDTLEEIAYEKAGIIKENGIAVTYPQEKEVMDVIRKACKERGAALIEVEDSGINLKSHSMNGQIFDLEFNDESYHNLKISLLGGHQLINARTAVAAIRALSINGTRIDGKKIHNGLKNVKWPGRLEVMGTKPKILLDGAHNLQGISGLKDALMKYFSYDRLIMVMGVLKDKQVSQMCDVIMPMADIILTVSPQSNRALASEELGRIALTYCNDVIVCSSINEAIEKAIGRHRKDDLLLFCGSLYMIGYVRELLEKAEY